MNDLHEEALWHAVVERDASYDGVFCYGVTTTGIYCRPQCPSRKPKRENAVLSFSRQALEHAGYRPCRRCRPDQKGPGDEVGAVVRLCRYIEVAEGIPSLCELAGLASMSESAVSRLFKNALGIAPRDYADAHRTERFREALRRGSGVLDAAYEAGYGSTSRVYENTNGRLGMTPKTYQKRGSGMSIGYDVVPTQLGHLLVAATDNGVCAVKLGDNPDALVRETEHELSAAELYRSLGPLSIWVTQLADYLAGKLPWPELPYDVRATAFQRKVWDYLRRIPVGSTKHYSEVATELGQPTATRAVARACATNPVALVVPCHRVVGKDGSLTGFRWGLERKKALLDIESHTAEP
ncbi:bifunctional transcriptional activator/DNA repair enzyme AdaA [Chloroflexota bacterium]